MPFDGLNIMSISNELNNLLAGARISKIHQPEKEEITLSIRHIENGNLNLVISAHARWNRIHITTTKKENPRQAPAFCMLLRKYLEGGKIISIKQLGLERIVYITIEAMNDFREWEEKILVCEFMGKHSNIILINPHTNLIIDAIKRYGHDVSTFREVLPGKQYIAPPDQGKLEPQETDYNTFVTAIWNQKSGSTLAKSLFQVYKGISPFAAPYLCCAAGLNPDLPVDECGELELSKLYTYMQELINRLSRDKVPAQILADESGPLEFASYPLICAPAKYKIQDMPSSNEACDFLFSFKFNQIMIAKQKQAIHHKIKDYLDKAYKKRFFQTADWEKAQKNEKYKLLGELLTAYAYQFKKGDTKITVNDFYSGKPIELELDPRYTPIENAQRYFKIYNKSRSALKHLAVLLKNNQAEIDYLESILLMVEQAENLRELEEIVQELQHENYWKRPAVKKKQDLKPLSPRSFISSNNYAIRVGRNNKQNDWLTLKSAESHDLWLHSKDIPGSHVILSLPREINDINQVPDKSIEEAAGLAAYFSKARSNSKVAVDYTFCYNVKKPAGAKPGMVIYEDYWTILVDPNSISELLSPEKE